jgi:hypothetical protein
MTKTYTFACFARSYNKYHLTRNTIHLVASIFYTLEDNSKKLFDNINTHSKILIRILNTNETIFKVIPHTNSILEFKISLPHFFENYSHDLNTKNFENFIVKIVGDYITLNDEEKKNILNNVLFVFEDLNWFHLQLLFRIGNVFISGGGNTRRYIMTSVHYNLNYFLFLMGYTTTDIYNSYKYLVNIDPNQPSTIVSHNKTLLILSITNIINDLLDSINKTLDCLNVDLSSKINNLSSLEKIIESNENTPLNIKRIKNNIKELKNIISKLNNEKTSLENRFSYLNKQKEELSQVSVEHLRNIYIKDFQNTKIDKELKLLHSLINKIADIS